LVGGRLGSLSLAASDPIANGILAKAVASFLVEQPQVRIALQSMSTLQVFDRIINREAELGVAYGLTSSEEVETELLTSTQLGCVMLPDHPLALLKHINLIQLQPHPIITYLPQALFRSQIDRALQRFGIELNIRTQVNLSVTAILLAELGAGVALVEPHLLASMRHTGLVVKPLRPVLKTEVLIIRKKLSVTSRVASEFVLHLKKVVAEMKAAQQ